MNKIVLILLALISHLVQARGQTAVTKSPDGKISVSVSLAGGKPGYSIQHQGKTALQHSVLGFTGEKEDFTGGNSWISAGKVEKVKDRYHLMTGKRTKVTYLANRREIRLTNSQGRPWKIVFQVSDDAVAFRYEVPRMDEQRILTEATTYRFDPSATGYLQPMQVSKTGWNRTNPAYEKHYVSGLAVTDTSRAKAGWVYPALFQAADQWALITEAGITRHDCATRLAATGDGSFQIAFADPREIMPGKGHLPIAAGRYTSPWRIITLGSLATIIESTAGTDLALPVTKGDFSFVKPGKSSWSWIMSKDDSIVYSEQVRYIDLAARMNWPYCLIDASWDRKIGYEKMKELARYAARKNVGLLLWYNSAGSWNDVRYTPKDQLLTADSRHKEFTRIKEMGIKGVKIDFFGGDGQSVMQYYIDILEDAAKAGLLVNFHGATLPRGWQRTYPHLLTTEAVRGFEMVTFDQKDADAQARHCTILPFARNAFDPMDFTPVNLYKIGSGINRRTTPGFELALSVLFLSGIQHIAESPQGMSQVPDYVQDFLKTLPDQWEDTRFIEGFPGKYVVLARKWKNRWYLTAINGERQERPLQLNLSRFGKRLTVIGDGERGTFNKHTTSTNAAVSIKLQPGGGMVAIIE